MNEEIIYFEINNWFCGRDYPNDETFRKWVANRNFSDDKWCKENKLCVLYGPIDMSENWCVSAPRSWVEENCPQLLSDKSFDYVTITYKTDKETGQPVNIREEFSKKYSEFLCKPDVYDEVYGHIDYWLFPEYCEENFGCKHTNQWFEDNYGGDYDYDDDDEEELDDN